MQSDSKKTVSAPESAFRIRHLFYLLAAILFLLAVISHHAHDYAVRAGGVDGVIQNWIGASGAVVAGSFFYFIGLGSYVLAALLLIAALRPFLPHRLARQWFWPGMAFTVLGAILLLALDPGSFASACEKLGLGRSGVPELALSGGVIGQLLAAPAYHSLPPGVLRMFIGTVGCSIVGSIFLAGGVFMVYRSEWHDMLMDLLSAAEEKRNIYGKVPVRYTEPAPAPLAPEPAPAPASIPVISEPEPLPAPEAVSAPAPAKTSLFARVLNLGKKNTASGNAEKPAMEAPAPAMPETAFAPQVPAAVPENPAVPAPMPMEIPAPAEVSAPASIAPAPEVSAPAAGNPAAVPPPATGLAKPTIIEAGTQAPKVRCANFTLPPITMLGKGQEIAGESPEAIARNKQIIQNTLDSFKIDGQVEGHISGPRVTRYEIRLAPSVLVTKVTGIENNIAMNLSAQSLRILAPIPGRDVVGVEVPNVRAEAIMMRSVLESEAWSKTKAEIPIVLGKDVAGKPVVLDLARAPHLLIAGATGTGKSVCMNTLIMSLLMKFGPDDLRLIMVDPKEVEFASYKNLPHLITPVIGDSKKVPTALRWATIEMDKRYKLLAKAGVRKLKEYNSRPISETPVLDDDGIPLPEKLPLLIVIIDELADLMMTDARSEIETSISRIAAKGRAAGVHVVLATQRPSRDVITGTIKGNLPTRIALRVVSIVDSRVILDQKGAEALLGMGDMLLLSPGGNALERIQGAWVEDGDINKVVEFISEQAPQEFDQQVVAEPEEDEEEDAPRKGRNGHSGRSAGASEDWTEEEADAFIDNGFESNPLVEKYLQPGDSEQMRKALEVVLLEKKASTSYLQRRLKIGYNTAAELIDLMEERGIVGPPSGSGSKRDILVFDDIIQG